VRKTLKNILVEYGSVAVVVYLVIFFLVIFAFWTAIRFGWKAESTAASVGAWTAAYLATKLTQPLRLAATVAITPFVARWYEHRVAPALGFAPRRPGNKRDLPPS
jgi:hypothetical protein